MCWGIVVKEKIAVGFPFFGSIPSDRIPKATKDVNVDLFIQSSNSSKVYLRIPGTVCSYFVLLVIVEVKKFSCVILPCLVHSESDYVACSRNAKYSTDKNGDTAISVSPFLLGISEDKVLHRSEPLPGK